MERPLLKEYVELFKRIHGISDQEWDFDSFYKPLKDTIENFTDEFLIKKITNLKQWATQKGII